MLLSLTSNLEFPSWRAPGFDPTHPAALNTRMSAVAPTSGAAFLNLLTGTRPTLSLTNPSSLVTPFGPAMNLQSGYTYNQFPYVIETPTAFTFAAILTTYSFANPGGVISPNGSTNSGQRFMVNSGGTFEIAAGAANFGSACVSGHTYFIAVSYTSSVSNWVLVDLSTGVTKTHTAGGAFQELIPTPPFKLARTTVQPTRPARMSWPPCTRSITSCRRRNFGSGPPILGPFGILTTAPIIASSASLRPAGWPSSGLRGRCSVGRRRLPAPPSSPPTALRRPARRALQRSP